MFLSKSSGGLGFRAPPAGFAQRGASGTGDSASGAKRPSQVSQKTDCFHLKGQHMSDKVTFGVYTEAVGDAPYRSLAQ